MAGNADIVARRTFGCERLRMVIAHYEAEAAIKRFLAQREQHAEQIRPLLFSWKRIFGRGLSAMATAYRVRAASGDGATHVYDFAFEPAGFAVGQNSGLKRFANGVWFDAN